MDLIKRAITCLLVVCLLATPVLACGGETQSETKEIRIGVIGPTFYVQGQHHRYGAEMAAEEINKAGGISIGEDTYRIKLFFANSNELLSVTDAANAMERLISVNRVSFVMGGIRTEAVQAMQDIAMDNKVIFLGSGAAAVELCTRVTENYDRYKYWFRVAPVNSDHLGHVSFQMLGMVAAAVAQKTGNTPRVAIFAEQAVWTDPIVAAAQANIPLMDMEVAGTWRVSATATDVTSELTAIRNAGANVIFTALSGPVGRHYVQKWGELEIPAASVGINVEAQDAGLKALPTKGNYETTLNMYARVNLTEKTIPFYDTFVDRFGEPPTYNAGTYEAMYVLKEAIERAGTLDPDSVVEEIEKTDRISPAGRITFDDSHDIVWSPGYVTTVGIQWLDGEMHCVWPPADGSWEDVSYEGVVPYKLPPWM